MNSTQLHYREATRRLEAAEALHSHDASMEMLLMAVTHALLATTTALETLTRQADPQPEAVAEAVGVLRTIPLHHHAHNAFGSDR